MYLPLGNRVALRRLDHPAPTASSMFAIPQDAHELNTECEVVAVPAEPYVTEFGQVIQCPVEAGQHVLVGKYTAKGQRVRMADGTEEELLYLRWEELLAVERAATEIE